MILFFLLAYLFFLVGIDTKTKKSVHYQEKSNTNYRITLLPSDIYNEQFPVENKLYLSSVIDDLIFFFNYQNTFTEVVSGYYKYNITSELLIYHDSLNNPLITKENIIKEDKYIVLNQGNISNFNLNDHFIIDYNNYLKIYENLTKNYQQDIIGTLIIKINFYEVLGFSSLKNDQLYENTILITIPISDTIFKANITELNNLNSFSEFSQKEDVNYLTLTIGIIFLSLAISFLILVVYTIKSIYKKQQYFTNNIKDLLIKYDHIIIKTSKLYNIKKYNLIYVTNFKELFEVHKNTNKLIIYKEIKKYYHAIFVILDGDTAWIYQLKNK